MSLTINDEVRNGITVLRATGEIDTYTAAFLEEQIRNNFDNEHYKLVIDLKDVNFVSSAGWGVFMGNASKLRSKSGDIKITGMAEKVRKAFELIELDILIDAFSSVDDAVHAF
jgi:anti-sigma B factor antagonist